MDINKVRFLTLQKIDSDAASRNVRDKIKQGLYIKEYYKESFKKLFQPLLDSQFGIKQSIDKQQKSLADQFADGFDRVLQRINLYVDNETEERKRKEEEQAAAEEGVEAIRQEIRQATPEQHEELKTDSTQPLLQIQEAVNRGLEQIQLERARKEQQIKEAQQALAQLHLEKDIKDEEQIRELERLRQIQQEQLEQQEQQAEELYQMGLKYEKLFDETKRRIDQQQSKETDQPQSLELGEIRDLYDEMKRLLDEQHLQLSQRPTQSELREEISR